MHVYLLCSLRISHGFVFFIFQLPARGTSNATCAHFYTWTSFKTTNTITMTIIVTIITIIITITITIFILIMIVTFGSPLTPHLCRFPLLVHAYISWDKLPSCGQP
jgi:hypothetical protein